MIFSIECRSLGRRVSLYDGNMNPRASTQSSILASLAAMRLIRSFIRGKPTGADDDEEVIARSSTNHTYHPYQNDLSPPLTYTLPDLAVFFIMCH
jgi:hypothetical protein